MISGTATPKSKSSVAWTLPKIMRNKRSIEPEERRSSFVTGELLAKISKYQCNNSSSLRSEVLQEKGHLPGAWIPDAASPGNFCKNPAQTSSALPSVFEVWKGKKKKQKKKKLIQFLTEELQRAGQASQDDAPNNESAERNSSGAHQQTAQTGFNS